MSTTSSSNTGLPVGSWKVDPAGSKLEFAVKTFWGLMTVHGRFNEFAGNLDVTDSGASGTLTIQTASLDTKDKKRDTHLRSDDFFGVEKNPTLQFVLSGAESAHGHVHLNGTLKLPGGDVPLMLHTDASDNDGLTLSTSTSLTREAAHMTWNQMGMIRGDIQLAAEVKLVKA